VIGFFAFAAPTAAVAFAGGFATVGTSSSGCASSGSVSLSESSSDSDSSDSEALAVFFLAALAPFLGLAAAVFSFSWQLLLLFSWLLFYWRARPWQQPEIATTGLPHLFCAPDRLSRRNMQVLQAQAKV